MERINNRIVDKLTFFQWLNAYEFMTKREFKELPQYKQDNYKAGYDLYLEGHYI